MINNIDRLKKLNEIYSNKGKQTLSEILKSFSCLNENTNIENNYKYSHNLFDDCTEDEKQKFISNQLELLECLVTNTIYDKVGIVWNWNNIYELMNDKNYKNVDKIQRKVVWPTSGNNRPIGDSAYLMWNGLQIIDLDIKDSKISDALKPIIFQELSKFHWFLGVCKSSSKKSLHVWTKITPISVTFENRRIEYLCNFRHKYSYIYIILLKYASQLGYEKENIFKYLDMSMAKPQQGIFISSDHSLISTNFNDTRLDVNFEMAFNTGIESINWISHPDLANIFKKLDWFNSDKFNENTNIEISNLDNINEYDINKSKGKRHYKHAQRWQLANTLTNIFGEVKAFHLLCNICSGTSARELKGDVKTAAIHNKPISVWAVKELNKYHGFNIKIKSEENESINKVVEEINNVSDKIDPIKVLNENVKKVQLYINKNQYLSDIKDDIIKNLDHITLLEAGAGYGKTEMIKSLKAKTLLILPFTSTIKAKVEADEKTADWLYFYGNKRPTLDDILGNHNISMTIDKFSKLNVYELDTANFEYIVIDESHLLFTSSYRDVMGPCIQRLANCKAKIIMMTGTPTGEILFFPNIKYINVKKEDTRIKECNVYLVPTTTEQLNDMCQSMVDDIINGKKILFPTNNGNIYYEQITGIIQRILNERNINKSIKAFYYKKSKYGEDTMEDINNHKTIGENDIIFCSTYLSVGVDICDKYNFSVYFSTTWIAQDIEQFANRLRNNDLYIKIFLPYEDENGFSIISDYVKPLDLSFNQHDLIFARDLVHTCNDMLERNEEESKYNPMISSLLSTNKYLKYDENDCKYYIDETTYKLKVFEERYSEYAKQLSIIKSNLEYYGYKVNIIKSTNKVSDDKKISIDELLKSCRNLKYNEDTIKIRKLLNHITDANIDQYRELLKGNYAIFKGKDEENTKIREENNLYVEDIEIIEKHTPVILSLYKYYDCENIKNIYEYCIDLKTNRLNFSKLKRIKSFVNIEMQRKKKRLDFPIMRFVNDSRKWTLDNPKTTKADINMFLATWTCKYCNSIKDLIVDDKEYIDMMFEIVQEYWKIIIIQSKPRNGEIHIHPFELLWETKQQLNDIYGNMNTQIFFLEQLVNEAKPEIENEEDKEEELPEFKKESKLKLEDIIDNIKDIIHKEFNYYDYSEKDMSNERFMRKQENTNSLRDNIFKVNKNNEEEKNINIDNSQLDIFENNSFENN